MPVDSITSPSMTGTRRIMDAFTQGSATGRIPSRRYLDQLIQAELDAASNNMIRNKAQAEQVRQFDVGQQNAMDTAEANRSANLTSSIASLGTTAGMMYLLAPDKAAAAPGVVASGAAVPGGGTALGSLGTGEAAATAGRLATIAGDTTLTAAPGVVSGTGAVIAPGAAVQGGGTALGSIGTGEAAATVAAGELAAGETAAASATGTSAGGISGGVAAAAPYAWPALGGYFAPKLLNAVHADSTENLGHNLSLGLVKNEKSASMLGSTATGAAAGAAIGSVVPVVGTAIGAVVGGIAGFFSSLF